jgi:SAM-dependent methyltransferase
LLEAARENGRIANLGGIEWIDGDAEDLPFPNGHFDIVVSQFAHMFAPRPDVTVAQMRRVLRPGGRIAFATWPPEHLVGRLFAFMSKYSPPPPPGVAPPPQWGIPSIVAERLENMFGEPFFARGVMKAPSLSPSHYREFAERSIGPMQKLIEACAKEPERLRTLRAEFETLVEPYHCANMVRQDYLLTRAKAL